MDEVTKTKTPNVEENELYQEEEDALSLSDFPLQNYSDDKRHSHKTRRSSSEPSEFFEFFTGTGNMSHAEDMIFRGKLVPFGTHHPFLKSLSADTATRFSRRTTVRSNSMSSTTRPRRYPDEKALRCSRRRGDRTRSSRSEGSQPSKPNKWFVLMFGPLKLHPEIDLRKMKSRVGRRQGKEAAGDDIQAAGRWSLWGFDWLRVLSCKSRTSVAVTSVGLAPPRF